MDDGKMNRIEVADVETNLDGDEASLYESTVYRSVASEERVAKEQQSSLANLKSDSDVLQNMANSSGTVCNRALALPQMGADKAMEMVA